MKRKYFVICAALPDEINRFCSMQKGSILSADCRQISFEYKSLCRLTVLVSGVGRHRMEGILNTLKKDHVDGWLSVGYAGALTDNLKVGDVVMGHTVATDHKTYEVDKPLLDKNLSSVLYCSETVVARPHDKKRLFQTSGAQLVDMESAVPAEVAQANHQRFGWIKVVSDRCEEKLSDFTPCLDEAGFPSPSNILRNAAANPFLLLSMIRMGLRNRRLSRNLAEALEGALDRICLYPILD